MRPEESGRCHKVGTACIPLLPRETPRGVARLALDVSSAGSEQDGVAFATSAAPSQQERHDRRATKQGRDLISLIRRLFLPRRHSLYLYWLDRAVRQPLMSVSALSANRGHGELLSSQSDSATKRISRGMLTATRYLQGDGTRSSVDEEIRSPCVCE